MKQNRKCSLISVPMGKRRCKIAYRGFEQNWGFSEQKQMSTLKVIAGLACMLAAFFLGSFAWVSLMWGELWFKFIPATFTLGLIGIGLLLIFKRNSSLSKHARRFVFVFLSSLILMAMILDIHIRHQRSELQKQAKAFLSRPIPKLLIPNSEGEVGGYYVDTNAGIANGVFGYSRVLIKRYATKGRIRWSAAIQGEFAGIGDNCLIGKPSNVFTRNSS